MINHVIVKAVMAVSKQP